MKAMFAALALVCASASADDWTPQDTTRELAFVGVLTLDYAQTRDIKNHDWAYEKNPLLGKHPSDTRIRNYFVGAAAAHYLIAKELPAGWPRKSWQYGWIALEVAQVVKNKRLGLHFQF